MRTSSGLWVVCLVVLMLSGISRESFAQGKSKTKSSPMPAFGGGNKFGGEIKAEAIELKPGDPLSVRALTSKPPAIKGIASWTLETKRHRSYLSVMSASPDAKFLATGGIDGTIRIWDLETGKLSRALVGHGSYVYGLSWSPDGNVLTSSGSYDYTAKVWDVKSGRCLQTLKGHEEPTTLCDWSPLGERFVVVGGSSGWLWLWNTGSEKKKNLTSFGHYVSSVSWSPDGERLAVTAAESPVSILNTWGGKSIHLGKFDDANTCCAWSPDGKRLATGNAKQIGLWNIDPADDSEKKEAEDKPNDAKEETEKKPAMMIEAPQATLASAALGVAWSADGTKLAVTNGSNVQLWDVKEAKSVATLPSGGSVTRLIWSHKANRIIGMSSTQLFVWDVSTPEAKLLHTINAGGTTPPVWTPGRAILSGMGTNKLTLWDLTSGKQLRSLEGHTSSIVAAAWSRDGKHIATGGYDNTARIWEASSGKLLHTLNDHKAAVTCLAFSLDGKTLATGGTEPVVRLWNASTGEATGKLEGHTGPITVISFPPSGAGLATGSADKTVKTWNLPKQQMIRSMELHSHVYSVAWTGDGKNQTLAVGHATEQILLFNVQTGRQSGKLEHGGSPPYVAGVAWSNDGSALFAGRGSHTAQVWDMRTNKVVHNLPTMSPVQYVYWPTGSSVVVAGNLDRSVRFWDARSGQLGGVIVEEPDHIVQLSTDGHYKIENDRDPELVVVALSEDGLTTHSVAEFAAKAKWKNNPASVRLGGK